MADEIAVQIEDRLGAVIKAAATGAADRVYADDEFRIDKAKTYVRIACSSSRLVENRFPGRHVVEVTDYSITATIFTTAAAAGGSPRRFVRNEAAKVRKAIAANRTLKDEHGVALVYRTRWQSQASAVDGTGENARAACQMNFIARTANADDDPTKSLPQLAAEQD